MKPWKKLIFAAAVILVTGGAFILWQVRSLNIAHSTFDNYYAFRGCTTLLERTDTYGTCTTKSGDTIKIVEYQGRWFLDGDLPCKTGICW